MIESIPFTWEAYNEAWQDNPDFDIFERFTFHHLSNAEKQAIRGRMMAAAQALEDEADALKFYAKNKEHPGENVEFIFPKGATP